MSVGWRPKIYNTPEDMEKVVFECFSKTIEEGRLLTITWLAIALGFNSRQSLLNYEGDKRYLDTIKKAKLMIEQYNEEKLYDKGTPTAWVIFNLVNNYKRENKLHNTNENNNKDIPLTKEEQDALNSVLKNNEEDRED